jgi:nitrite reductase/ring-hydroxylating ferredoxin subunit
LNDFDSERTSAGYVELCWLSDLPCDAARGFDLFGTGRDNLFLVRKRESVRAYRNICPHQGSALPWQRDAYLNANATRIVCSAHGAEFDIQTGQCTAGAALGYSLIPVRVVVAESGMIRASLADLPEARDSVLRN